MAELVTPLVFALGGPVGAGVLTSADVWARDMIAVTFADPMRVDDLLSDPENYAISGSDNVDPQVTDVLVGNAPSTTVVYLVIDRHVPGVEYTVTFQNLNTVAGLYTAVEACPFIGRETKIDSMVDSRPTMYDVRPRSRLRALLTAIGRQDDLIGGSRGDRFVVIGGSANS